MRESFFKMIGSGVFISCLWMGLLILSVNGISYAQCPNDNNYETTIVAPPPCGVDATVGLGAGTYVEIPVANGISYSFSTCGSSFDTEITGYNAAGAAPEFYNDNNGPGCGGNQASVSWTATFTGTLRVLVDVAPCIPCTLPPLNTDTIVNNCPSYGSATLKFRQNNDLLISSPGTPMCSGEVRNLLATPSGGFFFGTGVAGNQFTAPNLNGNYDIIYAKGQCTVIQTVMVNQNPTVNIVGNTGFCPGNSTILTADALPGSGSVATYQWKLDGGNVGVNSPTHTASAPGNYTVVVTNSNGCSAESVPHAVVISAPPTVSIIGDTFFCTGSSVLLTANAQAGSGSITTYQWKLNGGNVGINFPSHTANQPGAYTVVVTNSNGCFTESAAHQVAEKPNPSVSVSKTNITCNGFNDGTGTASPSGGQIPYSYSWNSNPVQNTQTATGLPVGDFHVTVTDAFGCSVVSSDVSITEPPLLTLVATDSTDASCPGVNNGTITVLAAGGTPPRQYSINGSPFQPSPVFNGLSAGSYTALVQDANGCQAFASTSIGNFTVLVLVVDSQQNITCNGQNNGSVTLSVSGGTGPYNFSKDGLLFQLSPTFSNLSAGSYSIMARDAVGCIDIIQVIITQPAVLIASVNTITHNLCEGDSSGTINITVSGGTTPYSFAWSNVGTTEDLSGLPAGFYEVTVTDTNGCTAVASATITEPPALNINLANLVNVNCNGTSTGIIDITVTGGTVPYSFSWSNGNGNEDNTFITAGDYYVTVTDKNACVLSDSFTITEPPLLVVNLAGTNVTCAGFADGSIDMTVTGGTAPYFYSWSNTETTEDIINLVANLYSVTVTDAKGCVKAANITITALSNITISGISTDVSCFGESDGSVDLTVVSGILPYSYLWSTGDTTEDLTGLSAGIYTVTVTDSLGCTGFFAANVVEPLELLLSLASLSDVSCNDGFDGGIDITVAGGNPPYSFSWSDGDTLEDNLLLTIGDYYVTVMDNNGCSISDSFTITEPPVLDVILAATHITCNGDKNGSIDLIVTGGVTPYWYFWSNGETIEDLDSLDNGLYVFTVTDNNGCLFTGSYTITAVSDIQVAASITNVTCFGDGDGAINITVSGGTSPYTFSWSNSETSEDLAGLNGGDYTVTITDSIGCIKEFTYTVVEPIELLLSLASLNNVSCFGGFDGAIDITMNGGNPPYSFAWSNGGTSEDQLSLTIGDYYVTVTDIKGCFVSDSFTVTEPLLLTVALSSTNIICSGDDNGTIDLTVSGGVAPYKFFWSNGDTVEDLTGLSEGLYVFTVTDNNGCQFQGSHTITVLSDMQISGTTTNVNCFGGNNGAIDVIVSGGIAPYTYFWDNGSTDEDQIGLIAGSYSLTVSDSIGCEKYFTATIAEPSDLLINLSSIKHVGCNGGFNGEIDVTVSGGTSPYSFAWSNGGTNEDVVSLIAGDYFITVTDSHGCIKSDTFTITEPAVLSVTVSATNITCSGDTNGAINLTVFGGTAPYSYLWSNGSTDQNQTGLSGGLYLFTVTDNNGCIFHGNNTILVQSNMQISGTASHVTCFGGADGAINITVTGGVNPYSFAWDNGATTEDLTGLSAGDYSLTVTDSLGCQKFFTTTITEPTQILISLASLSNITCNGGFDGEIDITVSGGNAPYSFAWSNGGSNEDNISLTAGNYHVTVTDNKGCVASDTFTITEPPALAVSINVTDITCNGIGNGEIDLTVSGGVSPYAYLWSNGDTTQDVTGLSGGLYLFTVTDNNGCQFFGSQTITVQSTLVINSTLTHVSCFGENDGAIDITVSGGITPYSYLWEDGSTLEDRTGLVAGSYGVTVTDSLGCIASGDFTITEPSRLNLTAQVTHVSCSGGTSGSINLSVIGGTSPYSYFWSNAFTIEDLTGLTSGTYHVTVTDAKGCTDTLSATINQSDSLNVIASVQTVSCNGGSDGAIFLTVTGGSSPYYYNWTDGRSTQNILNLSASSYSVTVTDNNGCTKSTSFSVSQPAALITSLVKTNVTCNGGSDANIDLTVTNGTAPYSYLWSNFATTQDLFGVPAGSYTVLITDNEGCVISDTVNISQPTPIIVTSSASNPDCFGFTQGGIDVTVSGGTPGYFYNWSTGETTQDLINVGAGNYVLSVTDTVGCVKEFSFDITQPDSLFISSLITHLICSGDSSGAVSISVAGGKQPYIYMWSSGQTTRSISNLAGGIYSLTLTDANGCISIDSFEVTEPAPMVTSMVAQHVTCAGFGDGMADLTVTGGTVPYTYLWSTFEFSQDIFSLSGGKYSVIATDTRGCFVIDTVTINEPLPLTLLTEAKGLQCGVSTGGVVITTVTGGTVPYHYHWSNGDSTPNLSNLTPGVFSVTVTDDNGCTITNSANVTAFAQPIVIFSAADVCDGQNVIFDNTSVISSGTMTYLWQFGDGDTSTLKNPTHLYPGPGTYNVWLFATSNNHCEDSLSHTVTVKPVPDATIASDGEGNVICFNDSLLLTVMGGEASYFWSTSDTVNEIMVHESGPYEVTVTNLLGCSSTDSVFVLVLDTLLANAGNDTTVSKGFSVKLFATGGASYQWEPGENLNDAQSDNPVATPLITVTYTVTITDENGCAVTRDVTVKVDQDYNLIIPNMFTPNGDGHNDTWNITNILNYPGCDIFIFNRWGTEIYSTKSYTNDWDGTINGKDLADGTYYYVVSCEESNYVYKGSITLLR